MLQIDVSVPEFGESLDIGHGTPLIGDGETVMVVLGKDDKPQVAFSLPADAAISVSRALWTAGRKAGGEKPGLMGILREARAENA